VLLTVASASAVLCLLSNMALANRLQGNAILAAFLWVALLIGAVIGIGWLADPNLLSMHGFYKERLTRAYLGASNTRATTRQSPMPRRATTSGPPIYGITPRVGRTIS